MTKIYSNRQNNLSQLKIRTKRKRNSRLIYNPRRIKNLRKLEKYIAWPIIKKLDIKNPIINLKLLLLNISINIIHKQIRGKKWQLPNKSINQWKSLVTPF
jgi:hypothetical protein